jgi:hypothetical protein
MMASLICQPVWGGPEGLVIVRRAPTLVPARGTCADTLRYMIVALGSQII